MKTCKLNVVLCAGALWLAAPLALPAQLFTNVISFDELPTQPVNGLSLEGVTFDFRLGGAPSVDANFGALTGPGATPFNAPPHLEGNAAGLLTLNFAQPTTLLRFGGHLSSQISLPVGLTVQLFDPAFTPIGGPISLAMAPSPMFVGGLFSYGGAPVGRAVVDFNDASGRFTMDNLTFNTPVPEPGVVGLGLLGLAGMVWRARRR